MKIAVVGLGVMGLSICERLAAAGHAVDGFDRATSKNPQGSSRGDSRIFRLVPGEGPVYVGLADTARQGWMRLERASGHTLINWTGGYMGGRAGSAFVESTRALAESHGRPHEILSPREAASRVHGWMRFPESWAILHLPDAGVIAADLACSTIGASALHYGARLVRGARIAGPIEEPVLDVDGDRRSYDRVILAAGPWTKQLYPDAPVRPQRRCVAWFAAASGKPRLDHALPLMCLDDDDGTYGMVVGDSYKIGLDSVGQDVPDPSLVAPPSEEDIRRITASVSSYLPMHSTQPLRTDVCMYTSTQDLNFLITEAPDRRVLRVSCCSGHGFKYGPAIGDVVLDWINERDNPALKAFSQGPHRAQAVVPVGSARITPQT